MGAEIELCNHWDVASQVEVDKQEKLKAQSSLCKWIGCGRPILTSLSACRVLAAMVKVWECVASVGRLC